MQFITFSAVLKYELHYVHTFVLVGPGQRFLFYDLHRSRISHHSLCCVITDRNLTPVERDDRNVSRVCLSHARPTQNTTRRSQP